MLPDMRLPMARIWLRRALGAAGMLLAVWALVAATGWAGCLGWQAELFANFSIAPVFAAAVTVALVAGFVGRFPAWLAGVAFITVVACTLASRPSLPVGVRSGATLKFATWNAYFGKFDARAILRWLARNDPDVIVFEEITQQLHGELERPLRSHYPYYLGNPRGGPNGLAIFSKVPIANWERLTGVAHFASCDLAWPGGPICKVVIAHPPAPTSGGWYRERGEVLRAIAGKIALDPRPAIVLGDFNSTWAVKDFREFCRATNLLPATDYLPSWNAALPGLLRIPIDHVLAGPGNFVAIAAVVGSEGAGGDHLPVMAEIGLLHSARTAIR